MQISNSLGGRVQSAHNFLFGDAEIWIPLEQTTSQSLLLVFHCYPFP